MAKRATGVEPGGPLLGRHSDRRGPDGAADSGVPRDEPPDPGWRGRVTVTFPAIVDSRFCAWIRWDVRAGRPEAWVPQADSARWRSPDGSLG